MGVWKWMYHYRSPLLVTLISLVLLPIPLVIQNEESMTGYLVLLMGIFWCTEIIPIYVTSFLPVVFFPLFGVLSAAEVCAIYMRDIVMLFIGGLIMAIGVENVNLHRRIGIKSVLVLGFKPKWLILGFMLPTWFLSMWISNTATTAMMMPILCAALEQLHKPTGSRQLEQLHSEETIISTADIGVKLEDHAEPVNTISLEVQSNISCVPVVDITSNSMKNLEGSGSSFDIPKEFEVDTVEDEDEAIKNTEKGMILCLAFAANAGSTGSLIGGGPNLVVQGASYELWRQHGMEAEAPITFTSWMAYGFPVAVISLIIVWVWLSIYFIGFREFFGCKKDGVDEQRLKNMRRAIEMEYKQLGKISGSEICVLALFALCIALWFFRRPLFMPGWGDLFKEGYITDAVPSILICVLLFIIPQMPNKEQRSKWENKNEVHMLLDWKTVQNKFPWGIIFLLGGGIALGEGVTVSGLAQWIGDVLDVFSGLPGTGIILIFSCLASGVSQVLSNMATASLFMPIVSVMALNMNLNPLYFMLPVAIASTFSFVLPVATGSNILAYSTGKFTVMDMVKAGIVPNIVLLPLAALATETWGYSLFNLGEIPWDTEVNTTAAAFVGDM